MRHIPGISATVGSTSLVFPKTTLIERMVVILTGKPPSTGVPRPEQDRRKGAASQIQDHGISDNNTSTQDSMQKTNPPRITAWRLPARPLGRLRNRHRGMDDIQIP